MKEVVETGKPVVVLLINGRPLSINYIAEHAQAILEGWYLGEEGGTAAANVLFGDVDPGGKLPITFPHSVGDLPDFYNHKPSANRSYAFSTRQPLFPFGYGLSYTTFKFENLHLEPAQIYIGGTAKVSVDVSNNGDREGDEVPQMYVHQRVASVTRPVMALRGFRRIHLNPGEKKTVEFTITPDALSLFDVDMHKVVEPGAFDVMVGPSSVQTQIVTLTVVGSEGPTGQSALSSAPAGSETEMVSNFDDLKLTARYGMWALTSDAEIGGKSQATLQPVAGGANGSKGALQVTGELVPGADFTWAGVAFHPGASADEAVNLSGKKELSFWAKGDGKSYAVAVVTESGAGQMPVIQPFTAGPEWKQNTFSWSDFKTDGHDVTGIVFAHAQEPGKFEFEIDEVKIK